MVLKSYFKAGLLPVLLFCILYPAVASGKMLIGVILTGNIPYYRSMHEALVDELKKSLPIAEDVKFVMQRPFPDPIAWSNAARKLIIGEVDMIISYGYPATNTVLSKRSNIPIVYVGVYNPESAIDGRNVTGCGYKVSMSRLLNYYQQIMPIKRLCVVYSHNEGDAVSQMKELAELAELQKIDLLRMDISSPEDLKKFDDIGNGDALFITGSTFAHVWIEDILSLLQGKKIPVVDIFPDLTEEGVLITLYQDPEQLGERAAELVAKIIAGEQPLKIEPVVLSETKLVFNLVHAKKLGINISKKLIGEATRVIE